MTLPADERRRQNARRRRAWDRQAARYDRQIGWFERHVFRADNREWVAGRARGEVLEVAVGTGLNLPCYPSDVHITGIDLSPEMLALARARAHDLGLDVALREGDAHELPFDDASFDTVVCTFSLCNIPDPDRAVQEMVRVLRPTGRLVLLDHIRSSVAPVYWLQKVLEALTVRVDGDHMTRRPLLAVQRQGLEVLERDRFRWGIVERLLAAKAA